MIRTVEFLQRLSMVDDITKYRGIPVSRYFLRPGLKSAPGCTGSQTRHTLICRVSTGSLDLWFTATAHKYIYDFTAILQVNEGVISALPVRPLTFL